MNKLFSNVVSDENNPQITPINLKPKEACLVFARGYNMIMKDAREANAVIRIGRSVLIHVPRMIAYYDSLCE